MTEIYESKRPMIAARLREARKMAGVRRARCELLELHRPTISEIELATVVYRRKSLPNSPKSMT